MTRNPRYDVLFEPVRIGPVTARNRFYQVPHASSTGFDMPNIRAGLRGIRAEGGWGVVCTGFCSIHPTADAMPHRYSRLWDEEDVRGLALMTEAVHRHGALAGVELFHGAAVTRNRYTREMPLSASGLPGLTVDGNRAFPLQTREMDRADIRALRQWQIDAAKRAQRAGFDIIYVYCGMNFGPYSFLSPRTNRRTDEYGGSIENRVRLLREMVEDTKEAVGDTCAVAVRLTTDELIGEGGLTWEEEGQAVLELLGDLPDLWDLKIYGEEDASNSRYSDEGFQEPYVAYAKPLTSRPVVGVGRFTSPDAMVSQILRGVLDLIGAARPSIADPFLPAKIDAGREDEIRECIGCNICYSCFHESVPIRCTQNPTMGEEWRRGWHPERIAPRESEDEVLVVGGGPAGLEAARALGQRGHRVLLAEAGTEMGGRLLRESRLPGLGAWMRVRDWRLGQLDRMANVERYFDSRLDASQVREFAIPRVVIATGARWTTELMDPRPGLTPAPASGNVLTPDDVHAGVGIARDVVVYDFEHYVTGSCIAEQLALAGHRVTFVTPGNEVSGWSRFTHEQAYAQQRILEVCERMMLSTFLVGCDGETATMSCRFTGEQTRVAAGSVVVVGMRSPVDELYRELVADAAALEAAGIRTVQKIGDCDVPGAVVHAVYAGHRLAREFDLAPSNEAVTYGLERAALPGDGPRGNAAD